MPAEKKMVVDIGINLTNKAFRTNWKDVVRRAIDNGVHRILLTGTSVRSSRESLKLAHEWYKAEGTPNLYVTVGIHPHDAKTWVDPSGEGVGEGGSAGELRELLKDPLAVAMGECGLDYNRNFSSKEEQIRAFRAQVKLAYELNYPLFVHEREAHGDLMRILDEVRSHIHENTSSPPSLPKIVVHCFTGTQEEAAAYIQRGYYLGFTGTICKKERGEPLRKILRAGLPLDKLMVETDAPFMGFKKRVEGGKQQRPSSEPADCVDVARQLAESIQCPFDEVCKQTTKTATDFFRLP